MLDHLKIRQVQQIHNILNGRPVEKGLWVFQPKLFRRRKDRLPEPAIPIHNDPGPRVADFPDLFKNQANVEQETSQIRQNDVVEVLAVEIQTLSRHLAELEVGVLLAGNPDHLTGDINPNSLP